MGVRRWAEGSNFQCLGLGASWGGGAGSCVCGPRVASRARACWGMACGGVACVHPLTVLSGVSSEWWADSRLDSPRSGDEALWLALQRKGAYFSVGRGGEASSNVSHKWCSLSTERRDPKEFLA